MQIINRAPIDTKKDDNHYEALVESSARFTYRLGRLNPRTSKARDLWPRCIIFLTLS